MNVNFHKPLVFVHVPKTAGTSFRIALERAFGQDSMIYDYGEQSRYTSPLVRRLMYPTPKLEQFRAEVLAGPAKVVCGHFPARRYAASFGIANTFLFLRDPVQRLISEYRHYARYYGYRRSFTEFYRDPEFTNRMSWFVDDVPLEDFALVGITEQYPRVLQIFDACLSWRLSNLTLLKARSAVQQVYQVRDDVARELRDRNAADIELYRDAVALFDRKSRELGRSARGARD